MKHTKTRPGPLFWFINYVIQNRGDVMSEAWMVSSYFRWYPYDQYGKLG